ncbi:MAG: hypothetical protein EOO38_28065 [Cytophagaceae bacterium]|nr:MAG: hypothetical protein EOO38_28065 [Cytophagaceae bacterium]
MDAALAASEKGSAALLLGGAGALLAIYLLSKVGSSVSTVLLSCGMAILVGGVVNVISARRFGLLNTRMSIAAIAMPGVAVLVLALFLNHAGNP